MANKIYTLIMAYGGSMHWTIHLGNALIVMTYLL